MHTYCTLTYSCTYTVSQCACVFINMHVCVYIYTERHTHGHNSTLFKTQCSLLCTATTMYLCPLRSFPQIGGMPGHRLISTNPAILCSLHYFTSAVQDSGWCVNSSFSAQSLGRHWGVLGHCHHVTTMLLPHSPTFKLSHSCLRMLVSLILTSNPVNLPKNTAV